MAGYGGVHGFVGDRCQSNCWLVLLDSHCKHAQRAPFEKGRRKGCLSLVTRLGYTLGARCAAVNIKDKQQVQPPQKKHPTGYDLLGSSSDLEGPNVKLRTASFRLGNAAARFRLPEPPRGDAAKAALQRLLLMRAVVALERRGRQPRVFVVGRHAQAHIHTQMHPHTHTHR